MNDHPHINPGLMTLSRPARVAQMPHWPGARMVLSLALTGAKLLQPLALGVDFPDGSSLCAEVVQEIPRDVPPEMRPKLADKLGKPPYLIVLTLDRGVGVKLVNGIAQRTAPNDTERAVADLAHILGEPAAVIGSGMNERDTRRSYYWSGI